MQNHANHRHTAAVGQGTQAGSSFNSWQQDTSPQSSVESATLTHSLGNDVTHNIPAPDDHVFTQPDAHAAFDILPPVKALYKIMRIS
jgi:hypothetical protein